MDINSLFTLAAGLITVTAFIETTPAPVNVTRTEYNDFKQNFGGYKRAVESRLNRPGNGVTEIKAICRECTYRENPV